MKKKYILIFLVCVLTLSTIFLTLTPASARYVKKLDTSYSLKSAEFYFVTNDDDIHIPYSNLNVDLDVFNFVGGRYSDKDINYSISISDGDGLMITTIFLLMEWMLGIVILSIEQYWGILKILII